MANINKETLLTQEYVKELFDYKDGYLYWKVKKTRIIKIGDCAARLSKRKKGDRYVIGIDYKRYLHSRVVFLYHKGFLPTIVDHEDRNTLNDRIENLRPADYFKNATNKRASVGKSSIYLGVSYLSNCNRYMAKGQRKIIGYFVTEIEAALAYNKYAVRNYGEFANLNIVTL